MRISRRRFLSGTLAAAATLQPGSLGSQVVDPSALGFPDHAREWHGESSAAAARRMARRSSRFAGDVEPPVPVQPLDRSAIAAHLAARIPSLSRHFIFEYYAWYETAPYRHWNLFDREPPFDLAANYVPSLGAYDSRSTAVIEQHARWIAELGVGAINVSWWGPGSRSDVIVPHVMDVMHAHDIRVTFHLEPYTDDRRGVYVRDILYLIEEYGEKRGWDAFLLLEHGDGTSGPVLKSFRTILTSEVTDCHGVVHPVPDYTSDEAWRRETDRLRNILRPDFSRVVLLADSLDPLRTSTSGFDGIAIYDNFVLPATWPGHARETRALDLYYSFNVNPGYDGIALRNVAEGSCYRPTGFEPAGPPVEWSDVGSREEAMRRSLNRIDESLDMTLRLQTEPSSANVRDGFFLVYLTSFNEWHEGHQFEPMKHARDLTPGERGFGYHNPEDGGIRFRHLQRQLRPFLGRTSTADPPGGGIAS